MEKITLDELTQHIRQKLQDVWDLPAVITGREGIGKSTLGYWLCYGVDENFNVEEGIVYTAKELRPKLFRTPRYGACLVDEGLAALYKREHSTYERKFIIKVLSQARQRNLFYAICCPRMGDLDEYLRNWRIRLWLHVVSRGKAAVYLYDDKVMIGDPWHLGDRKERRKRNLVGFVSFPAMPDDIKDMYRRIKAEAYKRMEKVLTEEEEDRQGQGLVESGMLLHIINRRLGKSYREIEKLTQEAGMKISRTMISRRVKKFAKARTAAGSGASPVPGAP